MNGTYASGNNQSSSARFNDDILHCPCPVPVNLKSGLAVNEYQVTRGELLISKVGPAGFQ